MIFATHETTFEYEGKEYPLSVSVHGRYGWAGGSKHSFDVTLNKVFQGYFIRDEKGFWMNRDSRPLHKLSPKRIKPPFELEAHDIQLIGEIIEKELGEYV